MSNLKSCPFCSEDVGVEEGWDGDEYCVHLYCKDCPAEMIVYGADKDEAWKHAEESWNRRSER